MSTENNGRVKCGCGQTSDPDGYCDGSHANLTNKTKKYVVIENNSYSDSFDFINEDTTDLDNIWHTTCSYEIEKSEMEKLKPMLFENRSDAKLFKDTQQRYSNNHWLENGHILKMYGSSKPKWKVVEYSEIMFSN